MLLKPLQQMRETPEMTSVSSSSRRRPARSRGGSLSLSGAAGELLQTDDGGRSLVPDEPVGEVTTGVEMEPGRLHGVFDALAATVTGPVLEAVKPGGLNSPYDLINRVKTDPSRRFVVRLLPAVACTRSR